jgi:hypothetical protein
MPHRTDTRDLGVRPRQVRYSGSYLGTGSARGPHQVELSHGMGLLRVTNHPGLWVICVSRSRITHVGALHVVHRVVVGSSSKSRCEVLRGSRPYLGCMPLVSGPVARPVADTATTTMLEQLTFGTTFLTVGGADAGYTEYESMTPERRRLHSGVRSGRS